MEVRVAGNSFAFLNLVSTIAYQNEGKTRLTEIPPGEITKAHDGFSEHCSWVDPDGGKWIFDARFVVHEDNIEGEFGVAVSEDREVLFLPLLTAFAGEGSFSTNKDHGLFAGLEYLDNEPSSSELDLVGPQSQRQMPPVHDITFPLMAIQAEGRYVGLAWDEPREFAALFDSPDSIFNSHGSVMGVVWPARDDGGRVPGLVLPKTPSLLAANKPLLLRAWIIAGKGYSLVPAIKDYVRLYGLPKVSASSSSYSDYTASARAGWLTSKIRVGDLYRHALAQGNFAPGPASDAAVFETWLASQENDPVAQSNLLNAAQAALAHVNPADRFHSGPGHIHTPAAALLFGPLSEAIDLARAEAADRLGRFDSEGRVIYRATPGGMDFGKGNATPDANGYTAASLIEALESAAFSGDRVLIDRAVEMLRKQDHFLGSTPRGVQVWELALHTPDIMAAAYLVRAYVDGYELTGDKHLLEEANQWAWAGLPFVYLRDPVDKPIGPYATIAVYGATHWQAPNWIGMPVQWCGLVYSDALYRLAEQSPAPWRQVADGITMSAVKQNYPLSDADHSGLLPDSFVLNSQHRNPPEINPATLGASAVRYYQTNTIYDFRGIPEKGILIHAPCHIELETTTPESATFLVDPWESQPFYVLINCLPSRPHPILVNGQTISLTSPNSYDTTRRQLILQLHGKSEVFLGFERF